MDRDQLLGGWALRSFTIELPDGSLIHPYGRDPIGSLLYSPSGRVSASLSKRDRGDFSIPTLERAATAPDAAKVRAFDGYTSYAGRFEVDGDVVQHIVEIALVPSAIGQTLQRLARFDDEALVLSYTSGSAECSYHHELRWDRA